MIRPTILAITAVFTLGTSAWAQSTPGAHKTEVIAHRAEVTTAYQDAEQSPLLKEDIADFHGLNYFDVDFNYKVNARYELVKKPKKFKMQTSTERQPMYRTFAKLYFEIDGKEYALNAYQNVEYAKKEGHELELFIPFTDKTSGEECYGGGRFLDISQPEEGKRYVVVDFNLSYNPYCAYNHNYSCPIPPEENFVPVRIEAGEKEFKEH
jgi:uncharacterized protein (DUF1684 family)